MSAQTHRVNIFSRFCICTQLYLRKFISRVRIPSDKALHIYYSLLALFLPLAILSCGGEQFKRIEVIDSFRVLGAISSTPEIAPGDTATVRLLVSDRLGGGRTITGTTEVCLDPGVAFGADPNCDHDPTKVSGTYSIDTASDADLGAANGYTGLATNSVSVTALAQLLVGKPERVQNNGLSYLVIFKMNVDNRTLTAFKRILVSLRGTKNSNPAVSDLSINGVSASAKPKKGDSIGASVSGPERYTYINADEQREDKEEKLLVAWYVSHGQLDRPKTDRGEATTYKTDAPGEPLTLIAVVHDDRGGMAYLRRILQ